MGRGLPLEGGAVEAYVWKEGKSVGSSAGEIRVGAPFTRSATLPFLIRSWSGFNNEVMHKLNIGSIACSSEPTAINDY